MNLISPQGRPRILICTNPRCQNPKIQDEIEFHQNHFEKGVFDTIQSHKSVSIEQNYILFMDQITETKQQISQQLVQQYKDHIESKLQSIIHKIQFDAQVLGSDQNTEQFYKEQFKKFPQIYEQKAEQFKNHEIQRFQDNNEIQSVQNMDEKLNQDDFEDNDFNNDDNDDDDDDDDEDNDNDYDQNFESEEEISNSIEEQYSPQQMKQLIEKRQDYIDISSDDEEEQQKSDKKISNEDINYELLNFKKVPVLIKNCELCLSKSNNLGNFLKLESKQNSRQKYYHETCLQFSMYQKQIQYKKRKQGSSDSVGCITNLKAIKNKYAKTRCAHCHKKYASVFCKDCGKYFHYENCTLININPKTTHKPEISECNLHLQINNLEDNNDGIQKDKELSEEEEEQQELEQEDQNQDLNLQNEIIEENLENQPQQLQNELQQFWELIKAGQNPLNYDIIFTQVQQQGGDLDPCYFCKGILEQENQGQTYLSSTKLVFHETCLDLSVRKKTPTYNNKSINNLAQIRQSLSSKICQNCEQPNAQVECTKCHKYFHCFKCVSDKFQINLKQTYKPQIYDCSLHNEQN